jgi:hypothetical protein
VSASSANISKNTIGFPAVKQGFTLEKEAEKALTRMSSMSEIISLWWYLFHKEVKS